ncbi:hypothetical protein K488DRAFT_35104, partial [Vararia minispora EC-137]
VAGHEGTTWNDITDARAEQAAQGYASHWALLPSVLRTMAPEDKLLASKSAMLQHQDERLRRQWLDEWRSSPRYLRLHALVPSLPYKGFLDL